MHAGENRRKGEPVLPVPLTAGNLLEFGEELRAALIELCQALMHLGWAGSLFRRARAPQFRHGCRVKVKKSLCTPSMNRQVIDFMRSGLSQN